MLKRLLYHVPKVIHPQGVGVFAHGGLQVVQLDLLQVFLPHNSPPALLFLHNRRKTFLNSVSFVYSKIGSFCCVPEKHKDLQEDAC